MGKKQNTYAGRWVDEVSVKQFSVTGLVGEEPRRQKTIGGPTTGEEATSSAKACS